MRGRDKEDKGEKNKKDQGEREIKKEDERKTKDKVNEGKGEKEIKRMRG